MAGVNDSMEVEVVPPYGGFDFEKFIDRIMKGKKILF